MSSKALRSAKEEQQELEALHRLDEECVYQQQAGDYLKAFDCMERALVLRRHFFGAESPEVLHACRALAEMCNLLSMSFLQQDNYAVTIDLLKKAEILSKHHPSEKATTLNNLACYYRRLGKLHAAMTCLKRALEIEKKLQNVRNAADTHLNICAVLSQLGKHQQALEQAQEALIILQEEFFQSKQQVIAVEKPGAMANGSPKNGTKRANGQDDADHGSPPVSSSQQLDRVSVMCIAYHNIGVEQEFLKDYANSVVSYKKGVGLAEQYLGVDHAITTTVRNSYLAAKRTISTKSATAKHRQPSDSPLSKSPGKASTRLINSPRSSGSSLTSSLRLPSPLPKDKQPHTANGGIPTPRSIVADVLAKGATLPPLDASAGKLGRSPIRGVLSPRDPFFSPRFRFESDDGDSGESKAPSSTKKKRKEVKIQAPAAEASEILSSEPNNDAVTTSTELAAAAGDISAGSHADALVEVSMAHSPESLPAAQVSSGHALVLAESVASVASARSGELHAQSAPDLTQENSSTFLQEEEPMTAPPVSASHTAEVEGDDGTGVKLPGWSESGDESVPPEAEQSNQIDPAADVFDPESALEESQFSSDDSSVDMILQAQTVSESEASPDAHLSYLSHTTSAIDSIDHDTAPIALTEAAGASESVSDASEVSRDIYDEEMCRTEDVEPEPASAEPSTHADESSEELSAPTVPASSPESLGSNEDVQADDEHYKEDILDILDESPGDLPSAGLGDDSGELSELPALQIDSEVVTNDAEDFLQTSDIVTAATVDATSEPLGAPDASEALGSGIEDTVPPPTADDGDASAASGEDGAGGFGDELLSTEHDAAPVDAERRALEFNEPAVQVSGDHDRAEREAVGDQSYLEDNEECPPAEDATDSVNWIAENDHVHSSETPAEQATSDPSSAIDELPYGEALELEPPLVFSHPDEEQSAFHHEEQLQSDCADAYGHEEYAQEGEFYHYDELDATAAASSAYEYSDHVGGETNTTGDERFERHSTPDAKYDDQFEHEAAEAADESGDGSHHLDASHEPSHYSAFEHGHEPGRHQLKLDNAASSTPAGSLAPAIHEGSGRRGVGLATLTSSSVAT